MSTFTLIIMLMGVTPGASGGMTSVSGFTTPDACVSQANWVMSQQVDRGARRIHAMCVEVK